MAALVLLAVGLLCACGAPPRAVQLPGPYGQPSPPEAGHPRGRPALSRLSPRPSLAGARDALCAVVAGGREVSCWGVVAHAALRTPSATPRRVAGLPDKDPVVQVAVGTTAACALLQSGYVVCWGANSYGELGNPSRQGSARPQYVQGLSHAARLVARGKTFCALGIDGTVSCWGNLSPFDGVRGAGALPTWRFGVANLIKTLPRPVVDLSLADGLGDDGRGGCVVHAGGKLSCWGETSMLVHYSDPFGALKGKLAPAPPQDRRSTHFRTARPVRKVFAGRGVTYFVTTDGALWCQGQGPEFACGGLRALMDQTAQVVPDAGPNVSGLAPSVNGVNACLLTRDGVVKCWGECASGICTAPKGYRFPKPDLRGYMGPAASRVRYLPVTRSILNDCKKNCVHGVTPIPGHGDGSVIFGMQLKCYYDCDINHRRLRQLKRSEQAGDVVSPQLVAGLKPRFVSLARTANKACAITAKDEVWCWGGGRRRAPRRVPLR